MVKKAKNSKLFQHFGAEVWFGSPQPTNGEIELGQKIVTCMGEYLAFS